MYKTLEDALLAQEAKILVYGEVKCDRSGNSRARQSVYTIDGGLLYQDGRKKSYWYLTENERRDFERKGGLVLCA